MSMLILRVYYHESNGSTTSSQDVEDLLEFIRRLIGLLDTEENTSEDVLQNEKRQETIRHLIAGGACGAVSRTCTAPLDRLKVFLQVNPTKQKLKACLYDLVYEGGIKGLWRGNGMNILKVVPESAIKFTVYEAVKKLIKSESSHENLSIYERFCAGAVAGGVSQTVVYPLDVMKTRLALGKTGQYNGIIKAVFKMYETKGMRSFYRGYLPNILGILPYAGIELAVYETLKKRYLTKHSKTHQESILSTLGCGVAASIVGQVFTYPLALVRTRLQAKAVPCSMVGEFKFILRKDGIFGLYRGITPNFIKVLPAAGISYVVYEFTRRKLGAHMT